eukprot:tig00001027_g6402.t1
MADRRHRSAALFSAGFFVGPHATRGVAVNARLASCRQQPPRALQRSYFLGAQPEARSFGARAARRGSPMSRALRALGPHERRPRTPASGSPYSDVTVATVEPSPVEESEAEASTSEAPAQDALLPVVLLNVAAVIWGSQHAVIKDAVETVSPGLLNLCRFGLAAATFLPFLPRDAATWRAGGELGLYMFGGFVLQSIGLQMTTASRSAFLLYLNVKFVPILGALLFGRRIGLEVWASAAVALSGTLLLAYDGLPPNEGDAWSVLAALVSALFILRLEGFAARHEAAPLNAASLWTTVALSAGYVAAMEGVPNLADVEGLWDQAAPIAFLGLVVTALSNFIQTVGQRYVSAEKASLIFALDPVYGAVFSYFILGETLGPRGLAGSALVVGAAIYSQLAGRTRSAPGAR